MAQCNLIAGLSFNNELQCHQKFSIHSFFYLSPYKIDHPYVTIKIQSYRKFIINERTKKLDSFHLRFSKVYHGYF
jgi:hypothetical protein